MKREVEYHCQHCGSTNILIKAWVNANTDEYAGDCDEDEWWCSDCEMETKPVIKARNSKEDEQR